MMKLTSILLLSPLIASAFTVSHYQPSSRTALRVAAEPETGSDINLILNGNNIELTAALNDYVEKRIGSPLRKLGGGGIVREVDVHLSVYKNPKVRFFIFVFERPLSRVIVQHDHSERSTLRHSAITLCVYD
jgi:ribosome-associated translation inhibitor RaiA